MGYDIGQFNEWNENKELDWSGLQFEKHQKLNDFVKDFIFMILKFKTGFRAV